MLVRVSRLLFFVVPLSLSAPLRATAADAGAKPAAAKAPDAGVAAPAPVQAGTITKPGKKVKAPKTPKPPKNPPVVLFTVNHKETFSLRLRDAQGKAIKGNQRRFERFLRCHHTEKKHSMNPRLMKLLYQTGRHWPGKRLEVVSGYRSPKVAKNPRSPHMKGLACDFRVELPLSSAAAALSPQWRLRGRSSCGGRRLSISEATAFHSPTP